MQMSLLEAMISGSNLTVASWKVTRRAIERNKTRDDVRLVFGQDNKVLVSGTVRW